jgi:hypothetical protein
MSAYRREQFAKNMARIDSFADRTGLAKRTLPALGKRILLLDLVSAPPLAEEKIEGYMAQHLVARQRGIVNNCFDIAKAARDAGRASGTMHANSGTDEFTGWGNHCINFDLLTDTTTVAVDLTASHNIDLRQGELDVLALRAADIGELCLQVGELFGGQWQIDK